MVLAQDFFSKKQIPFSRISVKDVKWLKNGHKCLILGEGTQGDIIYKLSYPDFTEINRVELNCRIKNMCLSKEHILAEIKDKQQVWIFDPSTLALKARISIGNASKLSACVNSTVAFVADYDHLIAIDPENAEKIYQKSSIQLFAELASSINQYNIRGLNSISITPDGKSFLAQCNYILFRCTLGKQGKLFPSDTIVGKYVKFFTLSNDSRYIALINSKKIIIRKIKDFSRIMTLNLPCARTFAFDMKARRLYVADAKGDLLILNARGKIINNYRIDRSDIKKILVHPQGNGRMLIISGPNLYWTTLKPNT
jgi:hypothetical protein